MDFQCAENLYSSLSRVGTETLSADRGLFRMSFGFDSAALVRSIKRIGLLNAPLIFLEDNMEINIVSGYRRIFALKELGCQNVSCIVLPQHLTKKECLLINFYDNVATRSFNAVEKAMVCSRLSALFPRSEIVRRFMPALGLPSHEAVLDLYNAIDAELDNEIKHALASARMSVKTVEELLKFPDKDRQTLMDLFSKMNFNSNQQIQVLDLIKDISLRDSKSVSAILEEDNFNSIIMDEAMNVPQKGRAFLDHCRRIRHPFLYSAERGFKSKVKSLKLPREVEIADPKCFEPGEFTMQISFKDGLQLKKTLSKTLSLPLEKLSLPWDGNRNETL